MKHEKPKYRIKNEYKKLKVAYAIFMAVLVVFGVCLYTYGITDALEAKRAQDAYAEKLQAQDAIEKADAEFAQSQAEQEAQRLAQEQAEREKQEAQAKAEAEKQKIEAQNASQKASVSTPTGNASNSSITNFKSQGVVYWGGKKWTWYSSRVLRHYKTSEWTLGADGVYRDSAGRIICASCDYAMGTQIATPWGAGIVLDVCPTSGTVDVYTNF